MTDKRQNRAWGRVYLAELYADDGGRLHLLPARSQSVYLVLCGHARNEIAFPSVSTIAKCLGCGLRVVQMALKALVEKGLVEIERPGGGRNRSTHYRITPPISAKHCAVSKDNHRSSLRSISENGAIPNDQRRNPAHEKAQGTAQEQKKNKKQQHAGSDLFAALQNAGVTGESLDRLAGLPGLTADDVRSVFRRAKAKASSSPVGLLVRMLADGERASESDLRAAREREWDALGSDVHNELYKAVLASYPNSCYAYGNIDCQRAMRKLAREKGLIKPLPSK